jgi:hypothetical protein
MADFVSQIDEINSLARSAPGFVSQPSLPDEGSVYTTPFVLNVSVWESIELLDAFTHQGRHATALDRRAEWFEQQTNSPCYVLFWILNDHVITEREIKKRLDHLGQHGASCYAFTFKKRFESSQALAAHASDSSVRS